MPDTYRRHARPATCSMNVLDGLQALSALSQPARSRLCQATIVCHSSIICICTIYIYYIHIRIQATSAFLINFFPKRFTDIFLHPLRMRTPPSKVGSVTRPNQNSFCILYNIVSICQYHQFVSSRYRCFPLFSPFNSGIPASHAQLAADITTKRPSLFDHYIITSWFISTFDHQTSMMEIPRKRRKNLFIIPSGKRLHSELENHHVSWENPLFLWSCSIANC